MNNVYVLCFTFYSCFDFPDFDVQAKIVSYCKQESLYFIYVYVQDKMKCHKTELGYKHRTMFILCVLHIIHFIHRLNIKIIKKRGAGT